MVTGSIPCGIAVPQVFLDTPVDMAFVRDFVGRAEALDYESLWVQESIVSDFAILEPVALLNYIAAMTSKARLGTSVLLTVLRNPVQLAKSLSSLDQMSQGRLIFGLGVGGHVPESIFGYSSELRARRFVEGIQAIKALWTEPKATVSGTFWNFENVAMEPQAGAKTSPAYLVWRARGKTAATGRPARGRLDGGRFVLNRGFHQTVGFDPAVSG